MSGTTGSGVAIVTGGSAGIGLAIARSLGAAGYRVVITGRDGSKARRAAESTGAATGADVTPVVADAGETGAMARVVQDTVARTGRLDVLVNNAGAGKLIPIASTTPADLTSLFAVNLNGPAEAIAAAWPIFEHQRRGCIVNISSWAALDPFPGFFIYSATKAALNSLTRSCWNEGRDLGIRPFTIGPGAVETDLLRSAFDESVIPQDACLRPEDVADLAMECITGTREQSLGRCLYIRRDPDTRKIIVVQDPDIPSH